MLYENPDDLTKGEKEILLLKAVFESINSMVNRNMFILHHNDPDSALLPHFDVHQKYFNILLVDLLSLETFEHRKADLFERLKYVCEKPCYNVDTDPLKKAVEDFEEWLGQDVKFEHDGEIRTFWIPSIAQEITLKIKREGFIKICGNISKHNPLGLDRQAKAIKKIFERNDVEITLTEILLIMDEFYEQFHDDLFNYHISTIAEFLNNLRWAIYEYLQPLFRKSVEYYRDDSDSLWRSKWHLPKDLKNEYIKAIFKDLMRDVSRKPYLPRFQVTRYLKMRY